MRLIKDERGQAMALFAVSLAVIVATAALALDVGRAHLVHAQQAAALDAAADAGAQAVQPQAGPNGDAYLTIDQTLATQLALALYDRNVQSTDAGQAAWTPGPLSVQVTQGPQGCTVQTSATAQVPVYFAPAIGQSGPIHIPDTASAHPHSLGIPCR